MRYPPVLVPPSFSEECWNNSIKRCYNCLSHSSHYNDWMYAAYNHFDTVYDHLQETWFSKFLNEPNTNLMPQQTQLVKMRRTKFNRISWAGWRNSNALCTCILEVPSLNGSQETGNPEFFMILFSPFTQLPR